MAVAVKNTPEVGSSPLDRLPVGSLVGVVYVLGSLGIVFGAAAVRCGGTSSVSAPTSFAAGSLLGVVMLAAAIGLVVLGAPRAGSQGAARYVRAGIFVGLVGAASGAAADALGQPVGRALGLRLGAVRRRRPGIVIVGGCRPRPAGAGALAVLPARRPRNGRGPARGPGLVHATRLQADAGAAGPPRHDPGHPAPGRRRHLHARSATRVLARGVRELGARSSRSPASVKLDGLTGDAVTELDRD